MTVAELLGLKVETESGESVGRVFDVRGELTSRSLRVTGLVVGRLGFLERMGIGAPEAGERVRGHEVVPWTAVVRADRRRVVVRDGTRLS